MNTLNTLCAAAALVAVFVPHALAGEGHDHGDEPAPVSGPALPRFSAVSDLFELVGVVDGKDLTLYLDRFADNSPASDAKVELQFDGKTVPLEAHGDGEFEATLERELGPGTVSITATVVAGDETDLLAGELDLHEDTHAEDEPADGDWKAYAPWLGAAVIVLGLVGWNVTGRSRSNRTGGRA